MFVCEKPAFNSWSSGPSLPSANWLILWSYFRVWAYWLLLFSGNVAVSSTVLTAGHRCSWHNPASIWRYLTSLFVLVFQSYCCTLQLSGCAVTDSYTASAATRDLGLELYWPTHFYCYWYFKFPISVLWSYPLALHSHLKLSISGRLCWVGMRILCVFWVWLRMARGVLKFSSLPCSRLFSEVDSSLLPLALSDAFSEVFLVSTLKQSQAFHIQLVGRDRHCSPWPLLPIYILPGIWTWRVRI